MKHIIIVVYDYTLIGGAEKVALNLANELVNSYKVTLATVFSKNNKPVVDLDDRVSVSVLDERLRSLTFNMFTYKNKIRRLMVKDGDNIIISITAGLNTIVKLASIGCEAKIIYAEHSNLQNNQYGLKHRFRQYLGAKTFDRVVTLTNADKENFTKKYVINKNKVLTIYNWVEDYSLEESAYNTDSKTIVSVGRLTKVKGYDRLIRIASRFFDRFSDWTWEIYGDGEEYNNIKSMIEDYNLSEQILLKGFTSDIDEALKDKSFFVSTSTFEGFPLSFLEARIHKLPIISFNCPTGPAEIINDGKDGYLIEPYSENKMLKKIVYLASSKNTRKKMSSNIGSNKSQFSKESSINRWKDLINNV